jgi:peroxiredoxin
MLPLGTTLPAFSLVDTKTGRDVSSSEFAGRPLVVAFICNHCPFVKHVQTGIAELGRFCEERGAFMAAISSNDPASHPADGPAEMAEVARRVGYGFPYLFDETQAVAKAFRAACTPEFYVFDESMRLAYRGQMDGARPNNRVPVTGQDVKDALDALLAGNAPSLEQKPSVGCNIKWKSGTGPEYGV